MLRQHIIDKSPRLQAIFANPRYAGVVRKETTSRVDLDVAKQRELLRKRRDELTRQLWAELHSKTNPTPEWFAGWLERVPNFGCNCRSEFETIIKNNPPRFDDWQRWSWEVHNAVNSKIGKPILTYSDACKLWAWDLTSPNPPA